jgi:hypothetical protein
MRTPTLTLLFLAITGVGVLAQPGPEETTARVRYGDDRAQPPSEKIATAASADGWVELASPTPASHGREFISVDDHAGAIKELRLSATSGRPYVSSVRVDFKDGTRRTFEIDRVAASGKRAIRVDLHGAKQIQQLIVVTDRTSPGTYLVEASPAEAGLASR